MRSEIGALIGSPVTALIGRIYAAVRRLAYAYADVEGRYFEYKGNPIEVLEGPGSERWLSIANVRRILPHLPRYPLLQRIYPGRTKTEGAFASEYIESLALVDLMQRSRDAGAIRFLRWLEREVIFPAEKKAAATDS